MNHLYMNDYKIEFYNINMYLLFYLVARINPLQSEVVSMKEEELNTMQPTAHGFKYVDFQDIYLILRELG